MEEYHRNQNSACQCIKTNNNTTTTTKKAYRMKRTKMQLKGVFLNKNEI